jgi:hypothetical protein
LAHWCEISSRRHGWSRNCRNQLNAHPLWGMLMSIFSYLPICSLLVVRAGLHMETCSQTRVGQAQ